MVTTIQIQDRTLEMLRKVKDETKSASYDEAIKKIILREQNKGSFFGYLGKKTRKEILRGLRDKNDRF